MTTHELAFSDVVVKRFHHAHVELHDGEPEAGRQQRPAAFLDLLHRGHAEPG